MFNWKSWFGSPKKETVQQPVFLHGSCQFLQSEDGLGVRYHCDQIKENDLCHVMISDSQGNFFQAIDPIWADGNGHFTYNVKCQNRLTQFFLPFGLAKNPSSQKEDEQPKLQIVVQRPQITHPIGSTSYQISYPFQPYVQSKHWRPLIALFMSVVRSSEEISASSVAKIRSIMMDEIGIPVAERNLLKKVLMKEPSSDLEECIELLFLRHPNYSKQALFSNLGKIVHAKGFVHKNERAVIRNIANYLGITGAKWIQLSKSLKLQKEAPKNSSKQAGGFFSGRKINNSQKINRENMDDYSKHYQPPPINPYKILGIAENATTKEIKKAYKNKMRIFHPDKYRDKPEEFQKIAEEKAQEISEAYQMLTK
jgi:DnaJ like chaperone protein